ARGPMLRLAVLRLGPQDHVVLMTVHHIAYDGWSTGVLVQEFTTLYRAIAEGRPPDLPPLPVQYPDFAYWQRRWLADGLLEGLIGFVVNTLVLRGNLAGDPTFRDLLRRTRETALAAYAHQDVPFERVVQAVSPNRDARHASLFQVLFVLQNAPVHIPSLPGIRHQMQFDYHNGTAKFDLTLGLTEMPDGLVGILEYNTDLFDAATAERMANHFRRL